MVAAVFQTAVNTVQIPYRVANNRPIAQRFLCSELFVARAAIGGLCCTVRSADEGINTSGNEAKTAAAEMLGVFVNTRDGDGIQISLFWMLLLQLMLSLLE